MLVTPLALPIALNIPLFDILGERDNNICTAKDAELLAYPPRSACHPHASDTYEYDALWVPKKRSVHP